MVSENESEKTIAEDDPNITNETNSDETSVTSGLETLQEDENSNAEKLISEKYVNAEGNCIIADMSAFQGSDIDKLLEYKITGNEGLSPEYVGKQIPGVILKIGASGFGTDNPDINLMEETYDKEHWNNSIFNSQSILAGTKYAIYYYSTAFTREEADKEIGRIKEFLDHAKERGIPPAILFLDKELYEPENPGRLYGKEITETTAYQIAILNQYVPTGLYTDDRSAGKNSPEKILNLEELYKLLNEREIPVILWGALIGDTEENRIKEAEFRKCCDIFLRQIKHDLVVNGQKLDVSVISDKDLLEIFGCKSFPELVNFKPERVELASSIKEELEEENPYINVTFPSDYYRN